MGSRTSLATLAGDKVEDVPGASDLTLLRVPLDKLVATRFNPRRNFGTKEQLLEFGLVLKKRQLQPAVVVSRSAYLKLWPDEAEHAGNATYVIANGERRYRASKEAGLGGLWVVHREEVASSKADFLDAVLSENNDRDDLDPIERAVGMETMVKELGGAGAVAKHYGKTGGWVSQQRKMLKLVPELQALVSSGEMPQREGYRIAGLPADEQVAEWQAELARRKEEERRRAESKPRKRQSLPTPRREKKSSAPETAGSTAQAPNGSAGLSALNGAAGAAGGSSEQSDGAERESEEFSALNNGEAAPEASASGASPGVREMSASANTAAGVQGPASPASEDDQSPVPSVEIRTRLAAEVDPDKTFPDLPWKNLDAVAGLICHHLEPHEARQLAMKLWALHPEH